MKSYLRFLSRNKLYTVIELFGLSISLAFVLLLGSIVLENQSYDRMIKDKDNLYLVRSELSSFYKPDPNVVFPQIAEATDWCNYIIHDAYDGKTQYIHTPDGSFKENIDPITARENFFEFFGFEMVYGKAADVLKTRNGVVLSERMANAIFPGQNPVGQTLILTEARMGDVDLIVTGVYKDYDKSTIPDTGIVLGYDFVTMAENPDLVNLAELGWRKPSSLHFIRLREDADIPAIEKFLIENTDTDPLQEFEAFRYKSMELLPFKKIHYDKRLFGSDYVRYVADKDLFGTFIFACFVLLAFAALNYISLTMAFSRFRVKEMATRQLLGTTRAGIFGRCIAEAGLLAIISWFLGLGTAFALEQNVENLTGIQIHLYSTPLEWIATAILIGLISVIAGIVPALVIARYSPVEVVKGEARRNDKVVVGRIFIAVEGALSIAAIAITIAIYSQTSQMVNTPMGYETEGLVYIGFGSHYDQKFEDELKALSFVEAVGSLRTPPTTNYGMMEYLTEDENPITVKSMSGDQTAFDLLGFKVIEDYGTARINYAGQEMKELYCRSLIENLKEHIEGNTITLGRTHQIDGIIEDFRMGTVKRAETATGSSFIISSPGKYDNFIVKVNGDIDEAITEIKDLYAGLKEADKQPSVESLEGMVENNYKEEMRILTMTAVFSLLNILMTIMAIIALSGYYAQMQTKDVAIRKSFGCSRTKVFFDTVIGFIWPVAAAAILAIPAAWFFIRHWLSKYPVRIENSLWIYISALAIVLIVVTASMASQAAGLMRTNPADVLKKE